MVNPRRWNLNKQSCHGDGPENGRFMCSPVMVLTAFLTGKRHYGSDVRLSVNVELLAVPWLGWFDAFMPLLSAPTMGRFVSVRQSDTSRRSGALLFHSIWN